MKKQITLGFMILFIVAIPWLMYGQALLPSDYHSIKSVQTPTSASLGTYGDVPVDLFTGTPSISIPLTSLRYNDIAVPISLFYHSGGIKVAEQPGWAGLGWDLMVGGQITRKVNWIPDEYYNRSPNLAGRNDYGYYYLGSKLNRSDWATSATMTSLLDPTNLDLLSDGEPDDFYFNFAGYSGSFYRSETGQWQIKSKQDLKLEIAEEIDNTGTYKLYRDFNIAGNPFTDSSTYEQINGIFKKFTIITPDGFQYVFGGDRNSIEFSRGPVAGPLGNDGLDATVNQRKNLITANAWYLTKIITPLNDTVIFNYKKNMVILQKSRAFSLAWDLEPLNGTSSFQSYGGDVLSSGISANNPVYLSSIETPLAKMEFVTSTEAGLGPEQTVISDPMAPMNPSELKQGVAANWADLNYAYSLPNSGTVQNNNQQLDSIKIWDKLRGVYVNGIKFFQSSTAGVRRTLDSIVLFDWSSANTQVYKFGYSNVSGLPFYESLRRDHWGFFNGGTEPTGPGGWPDHTPNNSYCLYGLINKIIYPTGGETDFVFEPSTYSSAINIDPNSSQPVSLATENGIAGIRIKQVTSNANFNSPPVITQYFYNKNYATGGNTSSGVLAAKPRYGDTVFFQNPGSGGYLGVCGGYFRLSNKTDNSSEWTGQVKGGIITYSEVTKKNADGSFTVYKYSNNDDPAYRDEYAVGYVNFGGNTTFQNNYRISSNDLERGQVLSEESYNSQGTKIKQNTYEYTNSSGRKNLFIKVLSKRVMEADGALNSYCPGTGMGGGMRAWATKIYYYKNPLKTVTETIYETDGAITNSKSYLYDNFGNITEASSLTSDGRSIVEKTKYNSHNDFLGTATSIQATRLKSFYINYKIKNLPVERTTLIRPVGGLIPAGSDQMTGAFLYEYNNDKPVLTQLQAMELTAPFYPVTYVGNQPTYNYTESQTNSSGNFIYDSRYKIQRTINNFTALPASIHPQPLSLSKPGAASEAYTWDYLASQPTSFTQNAVPTDIAFSSFEGKYLTSGANDDNMGNWSFDPNSITNNAFTGTRSLRIYTGNTGMNAVTSLNTLSSGKNYILSFWSTGTPPVVKLGTATLSVNNPAKTANGWSYYEYAITGNGLRVSVSIPSGGQVGYNTYLDELRLFPKTTSMLSYTYNATNGVATSICSVNGTVTFFEYDNFGRLKLVRDEQGNIVKQNDYQYQGPQ